MQGIPGRLRILALAIGLTGWWAAAPASATVVVPMTDEALVRGAGAILIGTVTRIEAEHDAARRLPYTRITLAVSEVLKGFAPEGEVTVRQLGGQVGGRRLRIDGTPEFTLGERALLFLGQHRDGSPRLYHLFQGKFRIQADPATGAETAVRAVPRGVRRPAERGTVPLTGSDARPLSEFKSRIRDLAGAQEGGLRTGRRPATLGTLPPAGISHGVTAFSYGPTPLRWFIEDSGNAPIPIHFATTPDPTAPGGGYPQLRAGLATWSGLAGSAFNFSEAGLAAGGGIADDGLNLVSFRDPLGQISAPSGCSGTLGVTGYAYYDEPRLVGGVTYYRMAEADVVFADGWEGCGFYESFSFLAEVAAHELGHVLGLDHTSGNVPSSDPLLSDPTMYFMAHDDGRGAALRLDDIAGVLAAYPAAATAAPRLGVNASQNDVLVGESLAADVWAVPGTGPGSASAFVALQLPDGSFQYLAPGGGLGPAALPLATGWPATQGGSGRVFAHTFTGAEPAGTYRWLAAMEVGGVLGPIHESPFSFHPAVSAPILELRLSRGLLRTGQRLGVTLLALADGPSVTRDIFVALELPDRSLLYLTPGGLGPTPAPLLQNWSASNAGEIFAHTFAGSEPAGNYRWLAAFATPGTANLVGPVVSAPFQFSP